MAILHKHYIKYQPKVYRLLSNVQHVLLKYIAYRNTNNILLVKTKK